MPVYPLKGALRLSQLNIDADKDWIGGGPFPTPGWWNTSWLRRKQITIAGTVSGALTDFPIKITVHKGTGVDSNFDVYNITCLANFADIRFITAAGAELPYWIESYTATEAVFWVNVDSIPIAPGTATIYIYYDNAAATSNSDGDTTFDFFYSNP